jgi:hypothetical protein
LTAEQMKRQLAATGAHQPISPTPAELASWMPALPEHRNIRLTMVF